MAGSGDGLCVGLGVRWLLGVGLCWSDVRLVVGCWVGGLGVAG